MKLFRSQIRFGYERNLFFTLFFICMLYFYRQISLLSVRYNQDRHTINADVDDDDYCDDDGDEMYMCM